MMSEGLPDPKLARPKRYVAVLASFHGRNLDLSEEDIELFTGAELGDELEDLCRWGMLEPFRKGYRPSGDYALEVSERCEEIVSRLYKSPSEMLEGDSEQIMEELNTALDYS